MSQRKRASSPSRIGRSPSLWAGASALALGAAILAPQAATAATFTASTEAELKAAIEAANASADVSSIIQLTQAITLSDPSSMPAAQKGITIQTNGFGFDNFGYAGAGTVTFNGGGQIDFSTTTASSFRGFVIVNSAARILAGANVTNTNGTGVNGTSVLRVDGGRLNTTGLTNTTTGAPATATIEIVNGGVIDMSTATQSSILANGANVNMNMTIDGAGSRLNTANNLSLATGVGTITVQNRGMLDIDGDFTLGTAAGTTQHHVTITDAGSSLDVGGTLLIARGTVDVLNGAHARSASLTIARSLNQPARLNVAGGAVFDTGTVSMGQLTSGNSTLTLQTGGVLNATDVTVGFSTTNFGNLVIGDVGAVTGAGTLNATSLNLRATTGALTFNHDTAGYVFATPISGAGTINHLAGDTHLTGDSSAFTGAAYVTGGTLSVEGKLGAATSIFDVRNAGAVARVLTGGELTASTVASSNGGLLSVEGLLTTGALTLASGDVSVLSGGLLTTTGQVNMGQGTLTLDGGRLDASILSGSTQTSGSSTIRLVNGGVLNLTGTTSVVANSTNATANLIVSGAGSRFSTANAFSFGTGLGVMTVSDGGAVEFGGRFNVGSPTGLLQHLVTVTGAGSSLIVNNGQLYIARGTLDLLAGARASANFVTLGVSANREATLNIAGGSVFDTPGAVAVGSLNSGATAFLTLQTGGVLNSDIVTVGSATRDGEVIIGGKTVVAGAGVLNAPSLFLTGTTGTLTFNHDTPDYAFDTPISGAGTINHKAGLTHLTGDSSTFTGATHVTGGTLYVDGVLGAAGSTLDIQAGGTLGGSGVIGGNVVSTGGTIAPGDSPGTLTIAGDLTLDSTSTLNVEFGESDVVGGLLNDLMIVGGNLTLDGTVNVVQTPGGVFDVGLYRIASYGGSLTDNGLAIGAVPSGSSVALQTAIAGQVNLVNTTGMAANFWDGDALLGVGNNTIEGGAGVWTSASSNWTLATGAVNSTYNPGDFAIFAGASGPVTVVGGVDVGGLQFAVDGYRLSGDQIALDGASAVVRVGDGTAPGQAYVATIDNVLGGTAQLVKTDLGTLVLSGDNTYAGGTRVSAGTLLVNGDQSAQTAANLVDASGTLGGVGRLGGDMTVNGTLAPGLATSPGVLTLDGDVAFGSTATLRYRLGQAGVAGGALNDLLVVNGDLTLDGTLEVSETAGGAFGLGTYRLIDYTGALTDNGLIVGATPGGAPVNVQTSILGQVNLVNSGGAALSFWDGDAPGAASDGVIQGGAGAWTAASGNWTTSTGAVNAAYNPGEFVVFGGAGGAVNASDAAGALSVGGMQFAVDGYQLSGDQIALSAGLATIRVGDGTAGGQAYVTTIDNVLGGAGQLVKTDLGTLVLNGANTYAGGAQVTSGVLLVNGDQSDQTAANLVGASGTLGGVGRLGGDITINGTLAPGLSTSPGTLTLDGDVVFGSTATLRYRLGQAGVAGGALNDLLVVNGDLTLDGTLDVSQSAGGTFGPGIYRLIDYTGTLTNNVLNLGTLATTYDSAVQTAIANQVNLVVSAPLFNFWDGDQGAADDGVITGGDGVWSTGSANWTKADGSTNAAYANGIFAIFAGAGGVVTVDASGQPITASGLQFAANGYRITGGAISLEAGDAVVRVGDGTAVGAAFTATIASALTGAGRLDKTDAGTLVLTGTNTYAGGTKVSGGVLQLGAGGTSGSITGDATVDGVLAFNRSDAFGFGGAISGAGLVAQIGSGVTTLTGDSAAFAGRTEVWSGTLAVDGVLGGGTEVMTGGRLAGAGTVGGLINQGVVAPGNGVGVLTVAGDYVGAGGVLEMEAQLGGVASASDRLVIRGATSGSTAVVVQRLAGGGVPAADGVLLVQVDGASNGVFTLANGDYSLDGENVLVGGAYGYVLRKDATGGDWRLRSAQGDSGQPLFQAGAPLYEAYPQTLQLLNGVSTLRQRVGSRQWSGQAVWGRMEGGHTRLEPVVSTTSAKLGADRWKMEFGMDKPIADAVMGGQLTGGLTVHYGEVRAKIASANGDGRIDTRGFGFGASLTWAGDGGGYADAQVQGSWFDSDLTSSQLGRRAGGVDGDGYAASLEVGKAVAVGSSFRLTPQAQLTYANTGFESFSDSFGAVVSDDKADSLRARLGLAVDRAWTVRNGEGGLYGLVNVSHEFLGGTRVDVSGAALDARNRRAWVGATVGVDYSWGQGRYMVYCQAVADTSVSGFGDSYDVTGSAGLRIRF